MGSSEGLGTASPLLFGGDNWIPRESGMNPLLCLSADRPLKVIELIDNTADCWNQEKPQQGFLTLDVNVIMQIPV